MKKSIEDAVGGDWMAKVSEAELNYFIDWAGECQTYFGEHAKGDLGDAFRGFVMGRRFPQVIE